MIIGLRGCSGLSGWELLAHCRKLRMTVKYYILARMYPNKYTPQNRPRAKFAPLKNRPKKLLKWSRGYRLRSHGMIWLVIYYKPFTPAGSDESAYFLTETNRSKFARGNRQLPKGKSVSNAPSFRGKLLVSRRVFLAGQISYLTTTKLKQNAIGMVSPKRANLVSFRANPPRSNQTLTGTSSILMWISIILLHILSTYTFLNRLVFHGVSPCFTHFSIGFSLIFSSDGRARRALLRSTDAPRS